jgi:NitT/TauT family transport system substrate-binding protein
MNFKPRILKEQLKYMQNKIFTRSLLTTILLLGLVLSACAQSASPTSVSSPEPTTLKIAVLPILDTLPMYVAQQEGLFAKHGVQVTFVPVGSAAERDQLISAGQADGMINEIVSTQFYNKDKIQVQIVRFAQAATSDSAMFRILASGKSGITSVDQLKGVPIGISQGTVIAYLTDRLLKAQGFSKDEIQTIAVPKIGDRMALLGSGELKAAMLPEPLSSLAEQQGAKVILDDTSRPEYSYSTIAFRKAVIDQHPEAIRAFLAAIEDATNLINQNPSKFSNLLTEQNLVPAPLSGTFPVPKFVTASVPTQAQWDDVLNWAKDNGLLSKDVSYQDSVTASFLP